MHLSPSAKHLLCWQIQRGSQQILSSIIQKDSVQGGRFHSDRTLVLLFRVEIKVDLICSMDKVEFVTSTVIMNHMLTTSLNIDCKTPRAH